jgi:hypothetical protein
MVRLIPSTRNYWQHRSAQKSGDAMPACAILNKAPKTRENTAIPVSY